MSCTPEQIEALAKEKCQTLVWRGFDKHDPNGEWVNELDMPEYRGYIKGFKESQELAAEEIQAMRVELEMYKSFTMRERVV